MAGTNGKPAPYIVGVGHTYISLPPSYLKLFLKNEVCGPHIHLFTPNPNSNHKPKPNPNSNPNPNPNSRPNPNPNPNSSISMGGYAL